MQTGPDDRGDGRIISGLDGANSHITASYPMPGMAKLHRHPAQPPHARSRVEVVTFLTRLMTVTPGRLEFPYTLNSAR
jgi:hypothetical protein